MTALCVFLWLGAAQVVAVDAFVARDPALRMGRRFPLSPAAAHYLRTWP